MINMSSHATTPVLDKPHIIKIDKRRKVDFSNYVKRSAADSDFSELVKRNLIIMYDNKPLIVYLVLKDIPDYDKILNILQNTEFSTNRRTTGLRTTSKIFGYSPRETIRKDYCSSTAFARDDPEGHNIICNFGKTLSKYYKKYCPEMFEYHDSISKQKIMDDWKIHSTPFTSGIINKNNPLKYHTDKGNISKVYSNMIVFKNKCSGGYLSIPEFDIGLECANKSVVFFDGQDILHGVTPFRLTGEESYRYSIVYYTLNQMWKCEPITEELVRIKERKTQRELLRYKRLTGELKPEDDLIYKSLESKAKQYRESKLKT
jgi:hypothetical protein